MFENLILEKHPTGSNYICNPPVTTTDIDFVCLLNEGDLKVAKAFAIADGWELCGKDYAPGDFLAFRKDKLNYICVDKEEIYNKWIAATEEAKSLNLLNKEDRIKCFEKHLGVKEKRQLWHDVVTFNPPLTPGTIINNVVYEHHIDPEPDRNQVEQVRFWEAFNNWVRQRDANRQW